MRAPFPWFGGKSRVADLVWDRFGNPPNYVEPFAGSLAVLLGRPHAPKTETVNDADCYLANFWRAVKAEPDEVAAFCEWPVNEADLLARHKWLLEREGFRHRMKLDPGFYDVQIAGWWVWGICQWIGSGWCRGEAQQLPHLGSAGRGVHRPAMKLPHLGSAGMGVQGWFRELQGRLKGVRVACGDWTRVLGESVTVTHGMTGVFLDPPYDADCSMPYAEACSSADVRAWALENGDNPLLRIALCGYEGEHEMPGWECVEWKARGGYGSQADGRGRKNAARERIWFSPHCLRPGGLFG